MTNYKAIPGSIVMIPEEVSRKNAFMNYVIELRSGRDVFLNSPIAEGPELTAFVYALSEVFGPRGLAELCNRFAWINDAVEKLAGNVTASIVGMPR